MNTLYLSFLWLLYYTLHSALAAERVKEFFKKGMPSLYIYYRFFFSLFAALNFGLLLIFHFMAPSFRLFESTSLMHGIAAFLALPGIVIIALALRQYRFSVWLYEEKKTENDHPVTNGINRFVRHPLYSGTILCLIAFLFYSPLLKNLAFVIISLIYVVIGSLLEEKKLIKRFGEEYREYRKRVKMLIPYVF